MLVSEFKNNNNGDLPVEFFESIPTKCPICNYPTEISDVLTHLCCSNPRCPSKLTRRLVAMASSLGVKGVGESMARKIIDYLAKFNMQNPLAVFTYEPEHDGVPDGVSVDAMKKITDQFRAKNSFTLPEYVRLANIPDVQTSATQIFADFDDLDEAYKHIGSDTTFIKKKLGIDISDDSESIRALKIYKSLYEFKSELEDGLKWVNIIKVHTEGMKHLVAVCSDEVGSPFKTKADFYSYINNMFPDIHVEFLGSVKKSIDYLVWAGADGSPARYTNKVKKVQGYNEKFNAGQGKDGDHYIPIVTASKFIDVVKNLEGQE